MTKVIGLTGGVGSGKSTVAHIMESVYGVKKILADEIGHLAYQTGSKTYHQICMLFHDACLNEDLSINRGKIASLVFENSELLEQLNAIVHPFAWRCIEKEIEKCRRERAPYVVLESAILYESGLDRLCDEVWYVHAAEELRLRRLRDSRGYSDEKSRHIMKSQLSPEILAAKADKELTNDGDFKKIREQLEFLLV